MVRFSPPPSLTVEVVFPDPPPELKKRDAKREEKRKRISADLGVGLPIDPIEIMKANDGIKYMSSTDQSRPAVIRSVRDQVARGLKRLVGASKAM